MAYAFHTYKLPSDLELTLVDGNNNQMTLNVHKNILANTAPYFSKLFGFGVEATSDKITINVSNLNIMFDLIMSFYDKKQNNLPEWKYKLEMIKSKFFLGLDYDPNLLANIKVPEEGFEQLINAIEMIGFTDENVKLINNNLPQDYDITKLSAELINQMIEIESNYSIASSGSDGNVRLWNLIDGQEINYSFKGSNGCISISHDHKWMSCPNDLPSGVIRLYETRTGKEIKTFLEHHFLVQCQSISTDNKLIISSSNSSTKLWNVETGNKIRTFKGDLANFGELCSASFSSDNKLIVSIHCTRQNIQLWDVETGKIVRTFNGHIGLVLCALFSFNNRWIASGGDDMTIKLSDVKSGQNIRTFFGHTANVNSVSFSSDDKWIISGSDDMGIKLWDVECGDLIGTFLGHVSCVSCVSFSPDNKWIISRECDGYIKLWDVETGQLIRNFIGHGGNICNVSFSKEKHPNEFAKKLMKYLN